MRTVENSLLLFLSCMLLISCTGKRSDGTIVNNEVALQTEEIHFPQQDVLQLKSYYLSSPVHGDSVNILIGYNYRLHSLDYLDLESKQVTQVTLPAKGPHAISRLSGIYVHSLDSVWVSDDSEHVFLVDSRGTVKDIVDLREYLDDKEQLLINTNYAIHTSRLYYNKNRQSLMFLTQNLSSKVFAVKEVFINKEKDVAIYYLSPSNIIPDMSAGYSYMSFPNVNYVGENIIYNYPAESSIYTLNIVTNERNSVMAESNYTSNIVAECTSGKDYAALERHRLENPYFYDVMYIPQYKMYARLHIDKVEFDADMGIEKLINDRDLYLMLFDDEMKKVYEVKLAKHRYNYFTGWCVSYSGIVLFVDNMLDTENNTDDLTIDFVYPK